MKPPQHKGCQILSHDAAGKIIYGIAAKFVSGLWDACGDDITCSPFEQPEPFGHNFWLYVVDCSAQAEARIPQILDFARPSNHFCYDDGWHIFSGPYQPSRTHSLMPLALQTF